MFDVVCRNAVVPLLLRLGLAAIFLYHGLDLVGGAGHQYGAAWNDKLPVPLQLMVAWGEVLGAIAMLLGFLTRAAAVGLIIIMVGAIVTVHWPHGFDVRQGGYEFNILIIIACVALVLVGGGDLAVDRLLFRRRPRAV